MNGGPRIRALDGNGAGTSPDEGQPLPVPSAPAEFAAGMVESGSETAEPAELPQGRLARVVPVLAAVVIAGWSGLFAIGRRVLAAPPASPAAVVDLVSAWALPVVLVLVLVLLARTSLREAGRHARAASLLAREGEALNRRLVAMNTELALAREFIAAQARDLEALGRIAVDRLSGTSDRLGELIGANRREIDQIDTVAARALGNMEVLRGHLPVIANSARDVANGIGNAGQTASEALDDLVAGFHRLNEFGQASGRKVDEVRRQVDAALSALAGTTERIAASGEDRLRAVTAALEAQRSRIDAEEVTALAAIRARAEALARELVAQREVIEQAEEDSLAALGRRIDALDGDVRRVAAGLAQAIEEVGRDHDGLIAASRQRLGAFEDSAGALNRALLAQADEVDAAIAGRRAELAAAMTDAGRIFTERLDALDTAIGQRRAALAAAAADAADALDNRMGAIDTALETRRQRQLDSIEALAATCAGLGEKIGALAETITRADADGGRITARLDAAMIALTARIDGTRAQLGGAQGDLDGLNTAATRLLDLIETSGEHTRTQLPEALRSATAGLTGIEERVTGLRDSLREAGDSGHRLASEIEASQARLGTVRGEIARITELMLARSAEQEQRLGALREILRAAQGESDTLSSAIERRLAEAIATLSRAAGEAGAAIGTTTAEEIDAIAGRLGEETSAALARVLQGRGAQLIARLEEAIDSAAGSARETAVQMRDQLAKIDELATNLESRVTRARERAEDQIDSDFARRTALITESLNSTAIDIARVLSADVSETAWSSYLRGERGIFTRRAVALLDTADARAVQQHYETNAEFRVHVNRYVHDFEGMLRQLLSTRDGNALGVTLLSSDMGKLYVALAQGIERLRT